MLVTRMSKIWTCIIETSIDFTPSVSIPPYVSSGLLYHFIKSIFQKTFFYFLKLNFNEYFVILFKERCKTLYFLLHSKRSKNISYLQVLRNAQEVCIMYLLRANHIYIKFRLCFSFCLENCFMDKLFSVIPSLRWPIQNW